ncbi:MAG: hypothetical protein KME49_29140 [Brasilonema octagenarum HA4186-MV1]|jgi:hypothetical protein|uniref:Uncharacterized protein n=2 Tax=Brasilonema TaxID=383614 RepID=A0A856MC71_9CYAN|nr:MULTISPECIES: hypothetical protein [Brasilonema]MBW4629470.1 hypothetical protein [Brasilonema octagenarum HA4186-MV1]NMF61993.1 hypothetical protein [Brasilonema octagenarum UFV-OR1]QDL08288.1 hypothetical protein DP114_10590 [Brasilonema sennae CENA114]QDL14645.1 hypothetical protein DP113_10530 [Brasilonema octagenarum UFV-E1]
MNPNKVNYNGRFEINDLIDDAVKNAVERRSQVIDSEDALLVLAETEAQSILGGAVAELSKSSICLPIITGKIAVPQPTPKPVCPPIVLGIMVAPDYLKDSASKA